MKMIVHKKDGSLKEYIIKEVKITDMPEGQEYPLSLHMNGFSDRNYLIMSSNIISDIRDLEKIEIS